MSEFQYYEFLALDHPLSLEDQRALRARSSRAEITAASFTNSYNYGNFKGNVDEWMGRYFDAHLYLANWGSRQVRLKFPRGIVTIRDVEAYAAELALEVADINGQVHVTFEREDDEPDDVWDEGPGLLGAIVGIRSEIAAGDFRPLYLGWLASVHFFDEEGYEESAEEEVDSRMEPACPPGLGALSPAQAALADFLSVDEDLLAAAAEGSRALDGGDLRVGLECWLGTLTEGERYDLLADLLVEGAGMVREAALARFRKEAKTAVEVPVRRSVEQLLARARILEGEREKREAAAARDAKERQARLDREAREKELSLLVGKEPLLWQRVEQIIAGKRISDYGTAVDYLRDLVDLGRRAGQAAEVERRIAEIRQAFASRRGLIRRLDEAGLGLPAGLTGRGGVR